MEENKVEEKVEEIKVEENDAEKKATFIENMKKRCCGEGSCKISCKYKGIVAGIVILLLLLAGSYGYKQYRQKMDIGQEAVKVKMQKFLTENIPAATKFEIKDITPDGSLYKINVLIDKQEVPLFITRDGRRFIDPQGIRELDKAPAADKQAQAPEKTEAENKVDVPTVDLFVMSYCPYGLQMERGILPAVEALGSKIKFNLKFVDYTLHGQKEVDENVNQYCVQKVAPTKLSKYLQCFWKDSKLAGTSAAATSCMKTTGINAAQVATCVADTKKQFSPTEKAMGLNKDETVKFGVQGSPTLVINGTTVSSGRDSASVLKAICSGFTTQPSECQEKLSATSPAAGFTDEALAGGASAAACGI